jgi:cytochrome P450
MGADMAIMETLLILAMVVQRYQIHLVAGHREEPECILDMIPRYGVRATLRKQPASARSLSAS